MFFGSCLRSEFLVCFFLPLIEKDVKSRGLRGGRAISRGAK